MATIFEAIWENDVEAARQMLKADPNLHKTINDFHDTPLHVAIRLRSAVIASMLVEVGADVNAIGDLGKTPLHYAAEDNASVEFARLLITNGAKINKRNRSGETPLNIAACQNLQVARFLLENGAELDLNSAVCLGLVDEVKRILREDPSLLDVRFPGFLLWQAVGNKSKEILQVLIQHGLKCTSLALFHALELILNRHADLETLDLLLNAGVKPNEMKNSSGDTAIQYTKRFRSKTARRVLELLRMHGASE